MSTKRIDSLDWLRGLLALSIMVYHLVTWELYTLQASSLLGRLGVYGVSMFFVLSGLSMAMVYDGAMQNLASAGRFIVRRLFRIWPVLWIVVIAVTAIKLLSGASPDWHLVALNLSTAFGFVRPDAYINVGAWSIGNEMVYYALTPALLWLYSKRLAYGNLCVLVTVVLGLWFAFSLLASDIPLSVQWSMYINPFNNLFLYCAGLAMYYNLAEWRAGPRDVVPLFALSAALFLMFPSAQDPIGIVTGSVRIALSCASILLVLAFYKAPFGLPGPVAKTLTELGIITYGVYLLHPVVYQTLGVMCEALGVDSSHRPLLLVGGTPIATIGAARVCFQFVEKPFIAVGKKLTSKQRAVPSVLPRAEQPA